MFTHGMVVSRCPAVPVGLGGGGSWLIGSGDFVQGPLAELLQPPGRKGLGADLGKDPAQCSKAAKGAGGSWNSWFCCVGAIGNCFW